MSLAVRACLVAAVLALVAMPGAAAVADTADTPTGSLSVSGTDASDYPTVRVTVTAPVALLDGDVPAEAFTLTENGDARAVEVSRLADETLQVALLVDTSGSMAGAPLTAVKQAALDFVDRLPQGVQVAVVPFATVPEQASGFTADREVAKGAIAGLEAGGRTATYDAVALAVEQFAALPEGRRAVVLISDGEDNQSATTLDEAAALLSTERVTLHVVELETRFSDVAALRRLADAGRGDVTSIDDPAAAGATYEAIRSKLVGQYELEYRSQANDQAQLVVTVEHGGGRATAETSVDLPAATPALTPAPTPTPTPAPAPVPPAAPEGAVPSPLSPVMQYLTGPYGLATGGAAVFLALAIVLLLALGPRPVRTTLHAAAWSGPARRRGGLANMGDWAEEHIDATLRRRDLAPALNRRLERAGILLKPSEFVVLAAASALTALAAGVLVRGLLLGLLLAAITLFGFRAYLVRRIAKRRAAFTAQLGDTLQLLSGSLRAGYGLLQAVDAVAKDGDSPTSDEFRRIVVETRLGRDLGEALQALSGRMASDDFAWVIQAIDIHREVGGDLAEVLDRVAETIRDRDQVARQIRSLSAEGRLSAKILIALPFVVAAGLSLMNPGYLTDLTQTGPGRFMIAVSAVLLTVGAVWISRLVKIEF